MFFEGSPKFLIDDDKRKELFAQQITNKIKRILR